MEVADIWEGLVPEGVGLPGVEQLTHFPWSFTDKLYTAWVVPINPKVVLIMCFELFLTNSPDRKPLLVTTSRLLIPSTSIEVQASVECYISNMSAELSSLIEKKAWDLGINCPWDPVLLTCIFIHSSGATSISFSPRFSHQLHRRNQAIMSGFVSFTKTYHNEPYAAIDPKRPELSAKGKLVVVTGGATGIGKAIAVAFAQAGAKTIAILARRLENLENAAAEITKEGSASDLKVLFESADVGKRESLDAAVASLTKKAGGVKVDILVHSAGVSQDLGPVKGYAESQFRYGLELNVIGAFNTVQSFAPALATNAHLYNVSSGMAHMAPMWVEHWSYAAGKAAVVKMFDYLQEQQPEWHVVQLQPGVVSTGLNARFGVVGQDKRKHSSDLILPS